MKFHENISSGFWPGFGLPTKGQCCHTKNQPLPKYLRKRRVKVLSTTCHYATKKNHLKYELMYLGLDIIIKFKFTTDFDKCAILNVLNYLTKNFLVLVSLFITKISTHKG